MRLTRFRKKRRFGAIARRRPRRSLRRRRPRLSRRGGKRRLGRRVRGRRFGRRRLLRRRRGGRRPRSNGSSGTMKINYSATMAPPPFTTATIGQFPSENRSTNFLTNSTYTAEAINPNVIGQYSFDFSNAFDNAVSAANRTLFRMIKFGVGRLTIQRVDSGASWGYMSYLANAYPTNFGVRETTLRIHYVRLDPTEIASYDWTYTNMLTDPRVRHRTLRCGRKMTLKFRPVDYSFRYNSEVTRRYNPVSPNGDTSYFRDVARPTDFRPVSWLPLSYVTRDTSALTNSWSAGAPTNPGVYEGLIHWRSPTILFCCDISQPASFPAAGGPVWVPVSSVLIRRSESCTMYLRGRRNNVATGVGQCTKVQPYPITPDSGAPAGNTSVQTAEVFARTYASCDATVPQFNVDLVTLTGLGNSAPLNVQLGPCAAGAPAAPEGA